jgi:hypothetical protein
MAFATLDSTINGANFTYSNGDLTVEKTSGVVALSTQLNQSFKYNYKRYYFEVVADVLDATNPFTGKMHFGLVPELRADDTDSLESSRPVGSMFFLNSTSASGAEAVTFDVLSDESVDIPTADFASHPMTGAGWDDTDVLGCVIDEVIPGETTGDGLIQVSFYLNGTHISTVDSGTYNWRGLSWTVALSLIDANDKITIRTDPADWTQIVPHYEVFPLATGAQAIRQTSVDTNYTRMTSGPWPLSHRNKRNISNDTDDPNLEQMLWDDSRDRLAVFNPKTTSSIVYSPEAFATKGHSRGKFYFEVTLSGTNWFASPPAWNIGWFGGPAMTGPQAGVKDSWSYKLDTRAFQNAFAGVTGIGSVGIPANGSVLGFACDLDRQDVDTGTWENAWYLNIDGTWEVDPDSDAVGSWFGGLGMGAGATKGLNFYNWVPGIKLNAFTPNGAEVATFNFGATAFSLGTLPVGFVAWDSTGIPA